MTENNKGLSPIAWVGIGCCGLTLVGLIATFGLVGFGLFKATEVASEMAEDFQANPTRAAAELALKLNPDIEVLSSDESAGTITFRDKSNGEETTLSFADIAEGKFSITTDEGEFKIDGENGMTIESSEGTTQFGGAASMDNVPDWVPLYPGSAEAQAAYTTSTDTESAGTLTLTTNDTSKAVLEHYRAWFEQEGWSNEGEQTNSTPGGEMASVSGRLEDDRRTLTVLAVSNEGQTQINLSYSLKK